jgi:FKBP-type peptidyl-prolyl cis-trans isomerase 2
MRSMKRSMSPAAFTFRTSAILVAGWLIGFVSAFSGEGANDRPITEGSKVTIAFTITVPNSSLMIPDNVSEYVSGQHEILPSLEDALTGMKPGEHKRVDLPVEEAFGPYDDNKKITLSREELPPDVETGTIYETPDGQPFTIIALSDTAGVVDLNHPLAGKPLIVDVQILKVEAELSEGIEEPSSFTPNQI